MSETAKIETTESAAPVADTSSAPVVADTKPAEAAKPTEGPKSLLEAISAAVPGEGEIKPAEAVKPATEAKPEDAAAAKPAEEEDPTKMPEGLSQKAQERFQKLAHMNKELTGRVEEITQAVEPFRQALQDNNIQREQFDQAAAVIGMMNKGDLEGALNVLDEQRRLISLAMGKPLPGIDALSDFPDLREAVDTMQITEGHALEIARTRSQQLQGQRITEQRQQQERTTKQNQQTVSAGLQAVDAFTKKMMETDLDYAAIESKLLPRVPKLLAGVPPHLWADTVSEAYQLIKEAGGVNRQTTTAPALRPTGTPSPASAPKNMLEAMFPSK